MEDCLWKIDRKPALHEEGEIVDEENDDLSIVQCKNSSSTADDSGIQESLNADLISNGDVTNKSNFNPFNKPFKINNKKLVKKKQKFDYSNLSDSELSEQFRQVSQQIQMLNTKDKQAFGDQQMHNQWLAMQRCTNGMQGDQSNQLINPQFNPTQFNNSQPNNVQFDNVPFNGSQQIHNQSPHRSPNQNRSFNKKLNNQSNNQAMLSMFNQQTSLKPADRAKLNKMLIAMSNILFGSKSKNNKNFSNGKRSVGNKNDNQMNHKNFNDKKRKFKDKNGSNKRHNQASNQPAKGRQSFNGKEINIHLGVNQFENNATFSPVITSDLFPTPNRYTNKMPKNKSNAKQTNQQVCRYFISGNCHKGNKCDFLHSNDKRMKIKELCKFYVQGACDKVTCVYMHKEFPCKFYHTGAQCYDAENCKFSHEPLTDEMSLVLKQFLTSKDKKVDSSNTEKVLLGTPTTEMRNSFHTWQWQQDLRKFESTHSGEDENFFKISNEFIIRDKPLTEDLTCRAKPYTANQPTEPHINEHITVKNESADFSLKKEQVNDSANELPDTHLYHRREHLMKKENNKPKNVSQGKQFTNGQTKANVGYVSKIGQIMANNKMSKMAKLSGNKGLSNAHLYKAGKNLDTTNSASNLIDKLAQETKIDSVARQSDIDKFTEFKNSLTFKDHSSAIKQHVDYTLINTNSEIVKPKSLLDEIMNSDGFVGVSTSLANLNSTKPIKPLTFPQQINQFPFITSVRSLEPSSFLQPSFNSTPLDTTCELDLFRSGNQNLGDEQLDLMSDRMNRNSANHLVMNTNSESNPHFVISKSPEDGFEFKLYYANKSIATYYEYELFYRINQSGRNDPRLINFFSPAANVRKPQKFSLFEQLDILAEQHEPKNAMCSLSELCNMRKKRAGSEGKDEIE